MDVSARLRAPAKVNLFLRIASRRPDGFHELDTIFLPLKEPCDTLLVTQAPPKAGLALTCSHPGLAGPDNLAAKAYRAFARAADFAPDLAVHLEKRIPLGAGLGGGSSDAAALLGHLNGLAGSKALSPARLNALAAGIGADVPFFLLGRPARARGIGEILEPVDLDLKGLTLVLACPEVHVPTAWAYGQWDRLENTCDRKAAGTGLTSRKNTHNDTVPLSPLTLRNDFERAVFPAYPELRALKERLYVLGAAAAVMSGSGASIVALFRSKERAQEASRSLESQKARTFVEELDWGVAKR